jgi:UDP-N-acetylglucosamine diphosphorylase/glucosamine-1-phosphate N-acetyltransferase
LPLFIHIFNGIDEPFTMVIISHSIAIVILAAGKGTRMKSNTAKVLHTIAGRPMIQFVVATAIKIANTNVIVVVGNQAADVQKVVLEEADVKFALQHQQKGTGHAVMCALPMLPSSCTDVVILSGDVPLIQSKTIQNLIDSHISSGNDVTVLAVQFNNPYGYGRIIQNEHGEIERIVEETDATEYERSINIINSGIYCVKRNFLEASLSQIKADNIQKEIYLTDIVKIARHTRKKVGLMIGSDQNEILGVNTVVDLQRVESLAGVYQAERDQY